MNRSMKIIGLAALGIFILGSLVIIALNESPKISIDKSPAPKSGEVLQPAGSSTPSAGPKTENLQPGAYTMANVKSHNSSKSCWTAINGEVYDVTSWINQHPGGTKTILSLCGIDGSAAFNGQHGGQRRPAQELASFKIGTLGN